jgi:hypothetical protein
MADSNITVSGLTATGEANQITLAWDTPLDPNVNGLPYLRFDATEVWKNSTNNRDAPQFVGETSGNIFTHRGVPRGASYYYWVRPRDRSHLYGEWFPASPTAGVVGTEANVVDAVLQPNGFMRYPDGRVEEWGQTISQSAVLSATDAEDQSYDGVVEHTFQTTFAEVFGIHAIAKLELDYLPPETVLPFDINNVIVSVVLLTTTQMRLRAVLAQNGAEVQFTALNGIRVYWRVFGT